MITVLNDPDIFAIIPFHNNKRLDRDIESWTISKKDFKLIDSLLRSKSLKYDSSPDTILGSLSKSI